MHREAVTALGQSAGARRSDVMEALAAARDGDPCAHVRKDRRSVREGLTRRPVLEASVGVDDPGFRARRADRGRVALALLHSYVTSSNDVFMEDVGALIPTDADMRGAMLGMLQVAALLLHGLESATGSTPAAVLDEVRRAITNDE